MALRNSLKIIFAAFLLLSQVSIYADVKIDKKKADLFSSNKDLKKHVKKLESFNEETPVHELAEFMISFKHFAEKETGYTVSFSDMYKDFRSTAKTLKFPIKPEKLEPFFDYLTDLENNSKKAWLFGPNFNEEVHPKVLLGTVYIMSAPLVASIGNSNIASAPYCFTKSTYFIAKGTSLIHEGAKK